MQISFTPTRCDTALTATRQGDVLTLNGEAFDFTALSEGDVMPRDAVITPEQTPSMQIDLAKRYADSVSRKTRRL